MYDLNGNYVPNPVTKREVQFIGELPHDGAWVIHAVPTSGAKWAIVVVDTLGKHVPRVIKDGAMRVLEAEHPKVPVGEVGDGGSGT